VRIWTGRWYGSPNGHQVGEVVCEVGSGLNGKRPKLRRILSDPSASLALVEHRDRLARCGLDAWSKSKKGERAGKAAGFPRFKTARARGSVRFTTGTIRVESSRRHVTLPRVGTIKTHESTRKLARRTGPPR